MKRNDSLVTGIDIMKLICDDYDQVYVWVEDQDEKIELSHRFDYEEDAILWKSRLEELLRAKP